MLTLPKVKAVADIELGKSPSLDAWIFHFLTENNLEYLLNPSIVSSPEQLRFMVALRDEQVYVPCSDALFFQVYNSIDESESLVNEYGMAWRFITTLLRSFGLPKAEHKRILLFCRYRFGAYFGSKMILPSRLIKRLLEIVITQCAVHDPHLEKKRLYNSHAMNVLRSANFQRSLQRYTPDSSVRMDIAEMRWELDFTEMARLIRLSTVKELWTTGLSHLVLEQEMADARDVCTEMRTLLAPDGAVRKKILFIPDAAGGFMLDLALINSLLRQGHQVLLALKGSYYFKTPTIWDVDRDPIVKEQLEQAGAYILNDDNVTKNELLQLLREHRFVVLSDGSSEQLNLYRVSVSFARAWKECDLVIAKGRRNKHVLLDTSHEFTRDILCCWRNAKGQFSMRAKPRASWVFKFAEKDLLNRAKELVQEMQQAKRQGKTVMFYSAIIGSIPGQTKVAIQLVNAFVRHLRSRMDNVFIINPAEHFEEGMDGDDLMFMWESVQRSGLLDVWRFQTVEDIETSFTLLGRKVPAEWSGKDSTFSTGCTKEMMIALSMQKQHPELQIIGPSAEKFFRRREYGIGKYFDVKLKG